MVVEERKQGENISRNQMQGKLMVCIYQYLLHVNMLEKPNMNEIIEGVFHHGNVVFGIALIAIVILFVNTLDFRYNYGDILGKVALISVNQ